MPVTETNNKNIDLLKNIPDILPVTLDGYEDWNTRIVERSLLTCRSYLSPNRREFYKIMYVTKDTGVFTLGLKNYYIDEPTILFLHPNDIITWKRLSNESAGYVCFFRKKLADEHPGLKAVIEKYGLFTDTGKSVIRLSQSQLPELNSIFAKIQELSLLDSGPLGDEAVQAYLQILMVACVRIAHYPKPDAVNDEFHDVHAFFQLLEKEVSNINYTTPVSIKTAQEFADRLFMHPNHLNALLKKHTGENVSTHIKNRLLEECKVILLQTQWTILEIANAMGFSDQPNFSIFFKKNVGMSPSEFRKAALV